MTYSDELKAIIDAWNQTPITDEWLFERFRERAIKSLSPTEAFEAIGDTVKALIHQFDESTATEVLQTLIVLARHSATTELHPFLEGHVADLVKQFAPYGDYARDKLDELMRFYRLSRH